MRDLEKWLDLGLRGSEYIEVDELEPLRQRIGEFLLTRNPVLVDGQSLKPILDRETIINCGIDPALRAENLEIADFAKLSRALDP